MYILLYLIALPVIYIATFRNDFDKEVMSRAYPFIFLCSVVMLVMFGSGAGHIRGSESRWNGRRVFG